MKLSAAWSELIVPADLVHFRCRDRYLVKNPGLAAFAFLDEPELDLLRALAAGAPHPPPTAVNVERTLATFVLNWLVYLPGREPRISTPAPRLQQVYYAITDGCNLRCPYCYASSTRRLPGELTTAESLDLVDQIAALGATQLIFTGGEPMLRRDLFTVADHARDLGLRVNIITNATRIGDAETARRIADTFALVTVSLDGGTAETHEPTRGKGTFAQTARGLALLNEAGVAPSINHVVTPGNVAYLDKLADFVGGLKFSKVKLMNHTGIGRGATDGVHFTFDDHLAVQRFVWQHPLARKLLTDGVKAASKPCVLRGNCGLGGNEIYLTSVGDVYPCKLVNDPKHNAGNIRKQSLAEIFESPLLADLRSNSVFQGENLKDCRTCYIRGSCGGGCRAYHAAESGDIKRNSRAHCRVLRHSMITSMWQAAGWTGQDLVDHHDEMTTPILVRDGTVHHAYEDWRPGAERTGAAVDGRPESRRLLPVVS